MRTFIAIEIPDEQKRAIAGLQETVRSGDTGIAWVRPGNVHITLKFLGDVPDERLVTVYSIAEAVCAGLAPFRIELHETGAFPDYRKPRVVWVGIGRGRDELRDLAESLDLALAGEGFPREARPFRPHVTIGRVKSPGGVAGTMEKLGTASFDAGGFQAAGAVVMKSDLRPDGAVYTVQRRAPFGPG